MSRWGEFGRIDVLFNLAARNRFARIEEVTDEGRGRRPPGRGRPGLLPVRAAWPHLRASRGVVNMASLLRGWKVTATPGDRPLRLRPKTSGSCVIKGDSGGPVCTADSSGRAHAKGIISGGGCGGSDHSGGYFDPCVLVFTGTGLANSAFRGTVAWS